jgi:four helix bundle protein
MRAAVSVPANLAEGYSRASNKEFLQFLSIARGSLAEVEYYIHFLARTGLIDATRHEALRELCKRAGQTLFGLMRSVRSDLAEEPTNRRYLREETDGYAAEPD